MGFIGFLPNMSGLQWVITVFFLKRNSVNDACRVFVIDVVGNEGHDRQKREKKPKKKSKDQKKKVRDVDIKKATREWGPK